MHDSCEVLVQDTPHVQKRRSSHLVSLSGGTYKNTPLIFESLCCAPELETQRVVSLYCFWSFVFYLRKAFISHCAKFLE